MSSTASSSRSSAPASRRRDGRDRLALPHRVGDHAAEREQREERPHARNHRRAAPGARRRRRTEDAGGRASCAIRPNQIVCAFVEASSRRCRACGPRLRATATARRRAQCVRAPARQGRSARRRATGRGRPSRSDGACSRQTRDRPASSTSPRRQNDRALDGVAQLAKIARPGVREHRLLRAMAENVSPGRRCFRLKIDEVVMRQEEEYPRDAREAPGSVSVMTFRR